MKIDFILDEGSSKEDAYFINNDTFGVFDGFNSLNKFKTKNGKTGGIIAATIAKNEFSQNKGSLFEMLLNANEKIRNKMFLFAINTNNKSNVWGTSAAVVKIRKNLFEWVQIQDSLILVIYKNNTFKLLVENYDHDKELLKIWKNLAKKKKENIRKLIEKDLIELRNKMNKACGAFRYGTLNGDKNITQFVSKGKENLKNIKHILLFTDGLIIPKENPSGNDDWEKLVKLFLEGGLKKIKDFIRKLEKDDPKCWKYPRYKQYDDIAAISISF